MSIALTSRLIEEKVEIEGVRLGTISGMDGYGRFLVEFDGNSDRPIPARLAVDLSMGLNALLGKKRQVLLVFENQSIENPIIIGFINDKIETDPQLVPLSKTESTDRNFHIEHDGKPFTIQAEHELVLRCGKGSITIHADGRIIIRGTNVLSRASQVNKIKGAAVSIN